MSAYESVPSDSLADSVTDSLAWHPALDPAVSGEALVAAAAAPSDRADPDRHSIDLLPAEPKIVMRKRQGFHRARF